MELAVEELAERLEGMGYERNAVAPVIVEDLPETIEREGFATASLSVGLGPDVFPTPTYRWFKTDGQTNTQVGSEASYDVPGGEEGDGIYFVEVSTSAGTATSSSVIVSTEDVAVSFTTDLPTALAVGFEETEELSVVVNANAYPQVTGYQWQKSATLNGTYTDIAAGSGGTQPTFTVPGTTGEPNGPGFYRVRVSNGTATVKTSAVCAVTTAP